MSDHMITRFEQIRRGPEVEHAWAEGDAAAFNGKPRNANPYTDDARLRGVWDLGFRGIPVPGLHHEEVFAVSNHRTVASLRVECGRISWNPQAPRHARREGKVA